MIPAAVLVVTIVVEETSGSLVTEAKLVPCKATGDDLALSELVEVSATTLNAPEVWSHATEATELDGSTENRPAPPSQQLLFAWSHQ